STTTTRARPSRCALRSMTPTVVVGSPDPRKPHSAFRLRLRAVTRPRASRTEEETGSRVVPHPPRHGTCRLERWLVSAAIRGRASSVRIDRLAAERHIDGAPAFERQRDLLPRSPGADRRDQRVRVVDDAVADLDHDVAPLETRLVGLAVGLDVGDGRAALPGVADRGIDEVLCRIADLDDVVGRAPRLVVRDREADTDVSGLLLAHPRGRAVDRRV